MPESGEVFAFVIGLLQMLVGVTITFYTAMFFGRHGNAYNKLREELNNAKILDIESFSKTIIISFQNQKKQPRTLFIQFLLDGCITKVTQTQMLIIVQFTVIMKNRVKKNKHIKELLSCCCIRAGSLELVIKEKLKNKKF